MAKFEVVTINEIHPDEQIAKFLSEGWEIIWQDHYLQQGDRGRTEIVHIVRFKRLAKPSYPTHYICTEDGNFNQQIERVKAVNANAELWYGDDTWQIQLDGKVIAEHNNLEYCLFTLGYVTDQAVDNG